MLKYLNRHFKNLSFLIVTMTFVVSCKYNKSQTSNLNSNEYTLTIYQDRFDPNKKSFLADNNVLTVQSVNDTTAYLLALNKFYNEKVKQRALLNYGQPKSFLIVDKNKIDLSLKLPKRMVDGLQTQVKSTPDTKKMLEDYNRDSLSVL